MDLGEIEKTVEFDADALRRQMDDLSARQRRVGFLVIAIFLFLDSLSDLAVGHGWRAALYAFAGSWLLLLEPVLYNRIKRHDLLDALVIATGFICLSVSVTTNGGLTNPRATLAIVLALCASIAIFGERYLLVTSIIFVAALTGVLMADEFGWLAALSIVSEPREYSHYMSTLSYMAILSCIWVVAHFQRLRSQLLAQVAWSAQQAEVRESRFLANMSHEIRSPLNGIHNLLERIQQDDDFARISERVDASLAVIQRVNTIVDQVLDYKRIRQGELQIEQESVDIYEVIRAARVAYVPMAEDKGVSVELRRDLSELPRFVIGDATCMFQVIVNIMTNAVTYTQRGSVKTHLDYDHARQMYLLQVVDTGVGMSEHQLKRVFSGIRSDESTGLKRYPSTGLGLAITQHLVAAMGGYMEVNSHEGAGTAVVISIPLPIDTDKEALWRSQMDVSQSIVAGADTLDLSGVRILCLDDVKVDVMVVAGIIADAGALVTTADSATEAFEELEANQFDAVLSDIDMPEMDGEELQNYIKAVNPSLPVIAVTGHVQPNQVARYLQNGFVEVVSKPVSADQLFAALLKAGVGKLRASV